MISTIQTTWWYGINPDTNFCSRCGCSVNQNTFERDWNKFDTFICKCGWVGHYDEFLTLKKIRLMKLKKINKNEK